MSSFSDELRNLIAKKAEQLDVAAALRERQVREEERKESQLVAMAAALVRDAFRPLVKEFGDVLEAAGAFVPGTVAVELRINPRSGANVSFRAQGGTGVFHVLLFAAATAEGRIELKAQCVLATKSAGPRRSSVRRKSPKPPGKSFFTPRIVGTRLRTTYSARMASPSSKSRVSEEKASPPTRPAWRPSRGHARR